MSSFNASELLRHGVSPSKVGVPANTQLSAIDFLCTRFPAIHREVWQQRFDAGDVLNAKGEHIAPSDLLYFRHVVDEPTLPFKAQIIFQDDHLVVADKPHFMPVTPGGQYVQQSLLVQLKQQLNLPELSPVHRIDRETAGLVVLSVRAQDRDAYQSLFRLRQVEKTYEAIAGAPETSPFNPQFPLIHRSWMVEDDKFFRMRELAADEIEKNEPFNSETWIDCVERMASSNSNIQTHTAHPSALAKYVLKPLTGQRHQLRVHMNSLGLSLVGDQFYPIVKRVESESEDFKQPLQLLANTVAFIDPLTRIKRQFSSLLELNY
jgi:tRNA pseudouridine32 synthase/23S rRNA pseudouridine746 synthase